MLHTDLDACIDVLCDYHAICKAFGPFDARCVCIDSCPSYQEPICSSNGTTYDNTCLFKQEMCLLQLNFTVQHPGSCEGTSDLVIYGLYCHKFFVFVFFFYQPNNPERRNVTDEVYYNVSTSQILNTTSSVWSRFKGINQLEISKFLSRLLKQSRSLNIYQAKTKLRVHSTLFKIEKGSVFIMSNCQKGHKETVHTWWLQLFRWFVCLFVCFFHICISVSLDRIPISARSASHASYTVLRILSLWGYSFPTICVLPRQNHPSADYCQSHRYRWQDLCPRCCCVNWIEDVTYEQFTACVMAAGFNERKSRANVSIDWVAYQGAPVGGVTGEVRMSQWWTGTTCKTVNFPSVSIFFSSFINVLSGCQSSQKYFFMNL